MATRLRQLNKMATRLRNYPPLRLPRLGDQPAHGLYLPDRFDSNHDGDTLTLVAPSGRKFIVRLDSICCAELNEPGGPAARDYVALVMSHARSISVFVPLPEDRNQDGIWDLSELLKQINFGRVPARVIVDGEDLGRALLDNGYASVGKQMGK